MRWNYMSTAAIFLLSAMMPLGHGQVMEQTSFSAEAEHMDHPVRIPIGILQLLAKRNDDINTELYKRHLTPDKTPHEWLSAAEVHLKDAAQKDYVVMAIGDFRGANVTRFWVFRSTPQGYAMVMAAPAHNLKIKNTRWKGYRDIELVSLNCCVINTVTLRFNGAEYKTYRQKTEKIK